MARVIVVTGATGVQGGAVGGIRPVCVSLWLIAPGRTILVQIQRICHPRYHPQSIEHRGTRFGRPSERYCLASQFL